MKFFDRFRKKKDEDQQPQPSDDLRVEPVELRVEPVESDSSVVAENAPAAAVTPDAVDAAIAPVAAPVDEPERGPIELAGTPTPSAPTVAPTPVQAEPPVGGGLEQTLNSAAPASTTPQARPVEAESEAQPTEPDISSASLPLPVAPGAEPEAEQKTGWFGRLRAGLKRTSGSFAEGMGNLFLGRKEIDDELLEDLETQLLVADVGIDATQHVIGNLTRRVSRKELDDADALYAALQQELEALLEPATQPLVIDGSRRPFVILMVGVNGVGKTTTIGKLARRYMGEGKSVLLAAGDTFRAAAVEQLQVWGDRNKVPVVAQHTGADSASVIFDALQAAQARGTDVLIADTAGRLHNKEHLMEELKKVVRVMQKLDPTAPHEVMLVLDAGTGQNALAQARHFQEAVGVSGITLTKLDGTAKGGIIFGISRQSQLPIRFIGVGEQAEDLRPFVAQDFVKALFERG